MEILHSRTTEPGLVMTALSERLTRVARICAKHGDYEAAVYRGHEAPCPECFRQQSEADAAAQAAQRAAEWRQRRADQLLGRAAIPPRFADRRLDSFVPHADGPKRALAIAKEFAEQFADGSKTGRSLIFCGGVGAGKTHLAVGICHEVIRQDRAAVFTSVLGAVRSIKDTYRRDSKDNEADAIARLVEPDLLVLDEVGVQFGSETEKMYLFEIINGRYEALKPTIVISNLAKDALTEYLGERVVDRLREGGGRMVIFDWPSYRRSAA